MIGTVFKTLFFLLVLSGVILTAGAVVWFFNAMNSPILLEAPISYELRDGASLSEVERDMLANDLLPAPHLFRLYAKLHPEFSSVKAGEYEIASGVTPLALLALFQQGSNVQRFVTIREGLTSYQVVQTLLDQPFLANKDIEVPAEGVLLPETYACRKGEARQEVIARMRAAMVKVLDAAWVDRMSDLPLKTKEEALILASIVEKETGVAEERKRVAGVFINRLRKGMKLQTDPTVIYALTMGEHEDGGKGPLGRRLLSKDLAYDSPYNTYLYAGLPPGPIANPGKDSIEAVLQPEAHSYLYFVADGTGGHVFAKSLAEHNRNVADWRKVRRSQNK